MRIAGLLAVVGAVLSLGVVSERCQPGTTPRLVRIIDLHHELSDGELRTLEYLIAPQILFHRNHSYIPTPFPLYVRIFSQEADYLTYRRDASKIATSSGGVYLYWRNEIIINKARKHFRNAIVHESQHAIFHYCLKNPPRWLNEGLSEVFETWYLDGNRIRGKPQKVKVERIRRWTAENGTISLRNLFLLSNTGWDRLTEEQKITAYTLSWGVVYYLISDRTRRNVLSRILRDLPAGRGKSLTLIEQKYPGGLTALELDWQNYFR